MSLTSWRLAKCSELRTRAENTSKHPGEDGNMEHLWFNLEWTNSSKLQLHNLCMQYTCLHQTSTPVQKETHPSQNLNSLLPNWVISVWMEQQSKAWFVWSPLPLVRFGLTGTSLEMGDWPWAMYSLLTGLESAAAVFTLLLLLEGHI